MLVHRRRFLFAALGAGGSLGVGAAAWLNQRTGQGAPAGEMELVRRTSRALGSEVTITVFHPQRSIAQRAVDAAFGELELVEELMSIYRPGSQLSQLNSHGRLDDPHPYLVQVLQAARAMSARSGGGFDATVQPLWQLYAAAKQSGRLPDPDEIEQALRKVDWRNVHVNQRRIELRGVGTAVTLNGIAQGFAADQVVAALGRHGIRHALVNTGEISALGRRPTGNAWTVGIQHPRASDAYVSLAALEGRSLSTSGDYATAFGDDLRQHHIFDPRTGRSPLNLASVSVVAATAMEADALSTAIFVLGPAAGLKLVRATPGADALLVLKNTRTLATPGFPIEA